MLTPLEQALIGSVLNIAQVEADTWAAGALKLEPAASQSADAIVAGAFGIPVASATGSAQTLLNTFGPVGISAIFALAEHAIGIQSAAAAAPQAGAPAGNSSGTPSA